MMTMRTLILFLLLLCSCKRDSPKPLDAREACTEFLYDTAHPPFLTCLILWCDEGISNHKTGGITSLWCVPVENVVETQPRQPL